MPDAVRRATGADLEDLLRLRALGQGSPGGSSPVPEEWAEQAARSLRERLPERDGDLAVFVADGRAGRPVSAAFGVVHRTRAAGSGAGSGTGTRTGTGTGTGRDGRADAPLGYVFDVVTEPGERRRGLAAAVMTELIAWFRERGVGRIELHSTGEAERLYERLGFTRGEPGQYGLTPDPQG